MASRQNNISGDALAVRRNAAAWNGSRKARVVGRGRHPYLSLSRSAASTLIISTQA